MKLLPETKSRGLLNVDIPQHLWLKAFTRDQLRYIAKYHRIVIGKTAENTALNLSLGRPYNIRSSRREFMVHLTIAGWTLETYFKETL